MSKVLEQAKKAASWLAGVSLFRNAIAARNTRAIVEIFAGGRAVNLGHLVRKIDTFMREELCSA